MKYEMANRFKPGKNINSN